MTHIKEEKLIEFLETGMITKEDESHLSNCKDCQNLKNELQEMLQMMADAPQKETPEHVRWGVEAAIKEQKGTSHNGQSYRWFQVAASISILLIGYWLGKTNGGNDQQIAALQDQIEELKEVTLTSALKTHTASERILAVNQIEESSSKSSDLLIHTLIETVNTDESSNVRYEAIHALEKFADNKLVRDELVKSLELQDDPLIQIALIRILVDTKEKSAVEPLKRMLDSDQVIPEVKQQAETAIKILI
ncbi:MAG: HEAT repeat domain-containing protein [Bacteroidota bacterium]